MFCFRLQHLRKVPFLFLCHEKNFSFVVFYLSESLAKYRYKKDVGTSLLFVPRTEVFAMPGIVEQTTSEPTPILRYTQTSCLHKRHIRTCSDRIRFHVGRDM